MKKLVSLALSAAVGITAAASLASCSKEKPVVGLICLHGDNSTYDKNFIEAFKSAAKSKGLSDDQIAIVVNIPEGNECYDAAKDLVDQGCKAIFADSFGHEKFLLKAAREFPEVQFCHATGTTAHTEKLDNFHNAFASIYEGRYLAGVAGGLKLKEKIENDELTAENYDSGKKGEGNVVIGYVGAYTYAEVISGYTSYYLGVKSVVENIVMDVTFTGSWYDETAEKSAANMLATAKSDKADEKKSGKAALISQHADSLGAPTACETNGIPNVSYNGSTQSAGPNTFIVSSRINWQPYYELMIDAAQNPDDESKKIPADWCGTLDTGSVELSDLGSVAAKGTQEKLNAVKAELMSGKLKVFDTSKFTVTKREAGTNGKDDTGLNVNATVFDGILTQYKADVDTDAAYTADTEVVEEATIDGKTVRYFAESKFRSAPYFDIQIDGINLLNAKF